MTKTLRLVSASLVILGAAASCGDGNVSSAEDAQKAYLGIDPSLDKAIQLGFDGFNASTNANIPMESTTGTKSGTLSVVGHVDQGASSNKTMNLTETYTHYSDDGMITYDSSATAPPALSMMLSNIPNGTLSGTLTGTVTMSGTLTGALTLNLTITANLMPGTNGATVARVAGSTHITGTATSPAGTYNVNVTK